MSEKSEIGKKGEGIAANYLRQKGYKILQQNFLFRKKEIDIIALKNECLVIVEVKTRSENSYEAPSDAVTRKKQRFLICAANDYLELHNLDYEVRFDIIGVILKNNKHIIDHIEDAFYATL